MSWAKCFGISFGSYSGMLTIALTSPVDGTIATTEPRRPASPFTAASCAAGSSEDCTLSPSWECPWSSSSTERNSVLLPTSSSLWESSKPTRPCVTKL